MRVLVVSAHYPPNFISGGTLGPQRIAHGLAARGHEVSVYAGWLGDREPLDTWTGDDGLGMLVRWIAVTPWVDWASRRNFDNPDVTADFRLHLDEVRPDLVHVHSLQALGVGIVRAAVEAGVRIVVTMHDFWWICARQFLANRALTHCCLVVSCGMCWCQVDRRHLDERNAELLDALRGVDQVLAVSETAASVLRANGIGLDPDGPELHVDENGLPPLSESPTSRPCTGVVRFLYTGGPEPMKGVHVVLDAARRLQAEPGWSLHAYGAAPFVEASGRPLAPPVCTPPPFSPAEADAVYSAADVVILPSIMRESHSLVTREALTRGIPVIISDVLGPEEVVMPGRNGLVVPAGDAEALAEAMRRIVRDGALREALQGGAREPIPVRPLEDQIDALDRRFSTLASTSSVRRTSTRDRPVRRVLFIVGIDGAPARYRAHFAAEALDLVGVKSWIRHYRSPENAALASFADAVVVYRVPATHQMLALIEATRAKGTAVFYDVDDLIFDPDVTAGVAAVQALPADELTLYDQGVRRYRTMLEACDAYIGSTEELVSHVRNQVGLAAHRWPNGVGMGPSRCADAALSRPRQPGPLRVGYMSGTKTHDHDWRFVEPAIVEVLRRRPDSELWLGGLVSPTDALAPFSARVKRLPMLPWWELPWILHDLDVNLAPLEPGSTFNEAKSAVKWLEAALAETVTVATPTLPFRECIDPGVNGQLAATVDEFAGHVLGLLDDDLTRARLGRRARRDALLRWSPHLQAQRYLEILEHGETGRTAPATWSAPEALDEPWLDVAIEDYFAPDPMILAPPTIDFTAHADEADGQARSDGRQPRNLDVVRRAVRATARRVRTTRA